MFFNSVILSFRYSGSTFNGFLAFCHNISRYSRLNCSSNQYVNSTGVRCALNLSENTWHQEQRQIPLSKSHLTDLLCLVKIWWALRNSLFQHTAHSPLIRTTLDQRSSAFLGRELFSRLVLALSLRTDSRKSLFSLFSFSFSVSFILFD